MRNIVGLLLLVGIISSKPEDNGKLPRLIQWSTLVESLPGYQYPEHYERSHQRNHVSSLVNPWPLEAYQPGIYQPE